MARSATPSLKDRTIFASRCWRIILSGNRITPAFLRSHVWRCATNPRHMAVIVISLGALLTVSWAQALNKDGAALFKQRCSVCHNGEENSRAPSPEVLHARSPEAILESLVNGAMRVQGASLSGAERRTIAEYLSSRKIAGDVTGAATGRCA